MDFRAPQHVIYGSGPHAQEVVCERTFSKARRDGPCVKYLPIYFIRAFGTKFGASSVRGCGEKEMR